MVNSRISNEKATLIIIHFLPKTKHPQYLKPILSSKTTSQILTHPENNLQKLASSHLYLSFQNRTGLHAPLSLAVVSQTQNRILEMLLSLAPSLVLPLQL